ncbi:hypothetical protein ACTA71_007273 [Dictyostelium dimigraforme]
MDKLFKSVFNNIYLSFLIFKFSRLYKKNEIVEFEDRESLLNFREREYIRKIVYYGSELMIGDLPNNGTLKEVSFYFPHRNEPVNGKIIPHGVEVIDFNCFPGSLNDYPLTLYKIINLYIPNCFINFQIPKNITSLSIPHCKSLETISKILPNSIKELEFESFNIYQDGNDEYKDEMIDKPKINLPDNLIKLSLGNYNVKYLEEGILPISIKELEISTQKIRDEFDKVNNEYFENNSNYSIGLFNILKPLGNLSVLSITTSSLITIESNLKDCNSIKDLTIFCNYRSDIKKGFLDHSIEEFSLPQSVTKLKILNFTINKVLSNVIPNGVRSLTIDRIEIDQLPQYLTYLKLYEKPGYTFTKDESLSLLSILPKSLTRLTIPHYFKDFNLNYHDNIKKIKFR